MPIQIKGANAPGASPHGEAAQETFSPETSEVSVTKSETGGEQEQVLHEYTSDPVPVTALYETMDVGMDFKMPVAQYTMLGFTVRRVRPFNPEEVSADEVFEDMKGWVEDKLNALIAEQQEG